MTSWEQSVTHDWSGVFALYRVSGRLRQTLLGQGVFGTVSIW